MGVLNVTPDSFSDGGRWYQRDAALKHALALLDEGADIIDIGGESTRPGAAKVDIEEETARVVPVIEAILQARPQAVISVDTIHAATALAAVAAGAAIVNDVSGGLGDRAMHRAVASTQAAYICQHWRGNPQTMDRLTDYPDGVVAGVISELNQRLEQAQAAGLAKERIIVDPGLGFAKTHEQSWQLLAATQRLQEELAAPVLIGASRKRFLTLAVAGGTDTARAADPAQRDNITATTSALAALGGAWAVRVHQVIPSREAIAAASLWKESR
jgi:dihydropteroate synthase